MRILTWNICCLPKKINPYHNPKKAINKIIDKILRLNPEVVKLQEVFDYDIQNKVINGLENNGYNIHISDKEHNFISKDGLLTASKYPIIDTCEYTFRNKTSIEYMIDKGILSTQIHYPTMYNQNKYNTLCLHNTHIQSDSMYGFSKECKEIRNKQFEETYQYLSEFNGPQIFSGDLNNDFNDKELNEMIDNLSLVKNNDKIVTFEEHDEQLDYILVSPHIKDLVIGYGLHGTALSDHYPLYMDIKAN